MKAVSVISEFIRGYLGLICTVMLAIKTILENEFVVLQLPFISETSVTCRTSKIT